MNFLSNLAKGDDKPSSEQPKKLSNHDLFGSAKIVAEAAKSQFSNEPEKFDKAKVAGAGADIIGSASDYGKLDETKGFGKYADQAETYLRQYSDSSTPKNAVPVPAEEKTVPPPAAEAVVEKPAPASESTEKAEGGYGDLAKLAGGFFKK